MSANQALFPIAAMARVLGVSTAGYYAWRSRPPCARSIADDALLKRVRTIHAVSRGTYGAPRVHAELRGEGQAAGKKRIARLMRTAGIIGISRRHGIITTRRNRHACPAPDLVDRNFAADRPNQLWVGDITYVPTAAGFLYLAVVLDAFSRRIVGWSMETHLRTELVLAALEMAIGQRKPFNVIHHSDQGSQAELN
jgi:putative transposase